jgi:hypothetical protein
MHGTRQYSHFMFSLLGTIVLFLLPTNAQSNIDNIHLSYPISERSDSRIHLRSHHHGSRYYQNRLLQNNNRTTIIKNLVEDFDLTFNDHSPPKILDEFYLQLLDTSGDLPTEPSLKTVASTLSYVLMLEINDRLFDRNNQARQVRSTVLEQQVLASTGSTTATAQSSNASTSEGSSSTVRNGSQLRMAVRVTFRHEPSPPEALVDLYIKNLMNDNTYFSKVYLGNLTIDAAGDTNLANVNSVQRQEIIASEPTASVTDTPTLAPTPSDNEIPIERPPTGDKPSNSQENGVNYGILIPVLVVGAALMIVVLFTAKNNTGFFGQRRRLGTASLSHISPTSPLGVDVYMDDQSDIFSFETMPADSPTKNRYGLTRQASIRVQQISPQEASNNRSEHESDIFGSIADSEVTSSPRYQGSRSVWSLFSGLTSKGSESTIPTSNLTKQQSVPSRRFQGAASGAGTPRSRMSSLYTFSEENESDLDNSTESAAVDATVGDKLGTVERSIENKEHVPLLSPNGTSRLKEIGQHLKSLENDNAREVSSANVPATTVAAAATANAVPFNNEGKKAIGITAGVVAAGAALAGGVAYMLNRGVNKQEKPKAEKNEENEETHDDLENQRSQVDVDSTSTGRKQREVNTILRRTSFPYDEQSPIVSSKKFDEQDQLLLILSSDSSSDVGQASINRKSLGPSPRLNKENNSDVEAYIHNEEASVYMSSASNSIETRTNVNEVTTQSDNSVENNIGASIIPWSPETISCYTPKISEDDMALTDETFFGNTSAGDKTLANSDTITPIKKNLTARSPKQVHLSWKDAETKASLTEKGSASRRGPGRRVGSGRRHAKSTAADGTSMYQADAMDPLDWSLTEYDDAATLSDTSDMDNEPSGNVTIRDVTSSDNEYASSLVPTATPKSNQSRNASLSPRSEHGHEVEASNNLLSDLVWLEQKIARSANAAKSPRTSLRKQNINEKVDLAPVDSLSFDSEDPIDVDSSAETSSVDMVNENNQLNGQNSTTHRAPAAIVCRDCFAPAGKLKIVIHSTKDGPAVHTVKRGSSLEGHVFAGDLIISVDNVDTRSYTAEQVMKMMTARSRFERKITVLHFEKEKS